MESTETEPLIESAVSSHANRGGNATNWWSYESLTIGEAAALHHGMPPELAFSPRCGPLQRAVMAGTILRLIGAVMTGSIRTIERYDSSNKTEITRDTAIITKDVSIFFGIASGQQETGSQQTASGKELAETEDKPLKENERIKLLKQIGLLALVLSEKSNIYKIGDKPNASKIADSILTILDGLPDANRKWVLSSSIRESIREGLDLLDK
ncbi:MAG: hypothetical protein WCH01_16170 [Methylococcaceae bacterium]